MALPAAWVWWEASTMRDGLGRHDPGQWRPLCMQYLMLIVVDLMKK
jgi:hypothetical protein